MSFLFCRGRSGAAGAATGRANGHELLPSFLGVIGSHTTSETAQTVNAATVIARGHFPPPPFSVLEAEAEVAT